MFTNLFGRILQLETSFVASCENDLPAEKAIFQRRTEQHKFYFNVLGEKDGVKVVDIVTFGDPMNYV